MDRLDDLETLLGEPVAGSLDATITLVPNRSRADLAVTAHDLRYGRYRANSIIGVGHRENVAGAS